MPRPRATRRRWNCCWAAASRSTHRYEHGLTALMWAAGQGQVEAVKVLLARGASVELRDDRGLTAKEIARQAGHGPVVEVLSAPH